VTSVSRVDQVPAEESGWGAVYALSATVIGLVSSEYLPISLLTPIAADLDISEGVAGRAVAFAAAAAVLSSLFTAAVTQRLDRRLVLRGFAILLVVSSALAAFAVNYPMLLAGRVLLGIAVGGFWSMAAAVTMRLVPPEDVPRAFATVYAGVAIAVVAAGPVASYVASFVGWRGVFMGSLIWGVFVFALQMRTVPALPPRSAFRLAAHFGLIKRREVRYGLIAVLMVYVGHFSFFTYSRPFLETIAGFDVSGVSWALLGYSLFNIIGVQSSRILIGRSLYMTLGLIPLLMACFALVLILSGQDATVAVVLLACWGAAFGAMQVAFTTRLTRVVPDAIESAGGLHFASVELAVGAGAWIGGILFDLTGAKGAFSGSGILLLLAAGFILAKLRRAAVSTA